jgi:hypothetical protein
MDLAPPPFNISIKIYLPQHQPRLIWESHA